MKRIKVKEVRPGLLVRLNPKDYSDHLQEQKARKRGMILRTLVSRHAHRRGKRIRVLWITGEVENLWIWQLRKL